MFYINVKYAVVNYFTSADVLKVKKYILTCNLVISTADFHMIIVVRVSFHDEKLEFFVTDQVPGF
jgi:hypothetical protein